MKEFILVISMWGNTGEEWVYTGNQYIMQELFTKQQCEVIAQNANWEKYEKNEYLGLQFDCFNKKDREWK